MQGGRHAARMVLRRIGGEPTQTFVYHDRGNMAIVGRGSAVADIRGLHFSGVIAWFAWLFLHVFELIGFANRLVVMVQWAAAYVTEQRSVRLITDVGRRSSDGVQSTRPTLAVRERARHQSDVRR
jgi:NADH dehydrogenase